MSYVNVGAFVNGRRPASKKALREALRTEPTSVEFDGTALGDGRIYQERDIRPHVNFTVVGPDPYTSRKFYATVTRALNGNIKIT